MSKTRIIENIYIDREKFIRAGVELGKTILYDVQPSAFVNEVCDVVTGRIGWKNGKIYYDDMYADEYKQIMNQYYTDLLTSKGYTTSTAKVGNKIIITARR